MEETDISELEKRYWTLKSQSKSGKFDLDTFKAMVCPPVPEAICESKCIVKGFEFPTYVDVLKLLYLHVC